MNVIMQVQLLEHFAQKLLIYPQKKIRQRC